MNSAITFKVGVRRKIPYITNLFVIIAGLCFLLILVFDFLFSPFRSAPQEMQVAIFYWIVPAFWQKVVIFSAVGFFIASMLFILLRYYKSASLFFYSTAMLLKSKTFKLSIPICSIRKIYCNDAHKINGELIGKFSIIIELKRKKKAIVIRLKNYGEVDKFMEYLMLYENLDLKFYNFSHTPVHMGEE